MDLMVIMRIVLVLMETIGISLMVYIGFLVV